MKSVNPWAKKIALVWLLLASYGLNAAEELPREAGEAQRYTYDYLFMIDVLIRNEKYHRARVELDALLERVKREPDETALARQAYGFLSLGLKDYASAIDHFLFAIDSGALPSPVSLNLRYILAQLLYQEARYQAGIAQLQRWFREVDKPTAQSWVLLASLHYGLKQYHKAIEALKQAIDLSPSPQESWYQMLVGLYIETQQYKQSVPLLQKLVKQYPHKEDYWQQLSDVLLQLGRDHKAVAVLSLAAERGLVDESGLIRLAKLMLQLNNPLDAAELLTEKIEHGEIKPGKEPLYLLADAWLLARDQQQALKVFEQLGTIDKSGKPQLRMGRLLIEMEQWQAAQAELELGIERTPNPVFEDWLLLGSTHYRLENHSDARLAFESALGATTKQEQRQLAQRWIDYLKQQ
jgi:tetratricopeptide (TPR) repeat protein